MILLTQNVINMRVSCSTKGDFIPVLATTMVEAASLRGKQLNASGASSSP